MFGSVLNRQRLGIQTKIDIILRNLWLFRLAPSNPGLQELNNQLRYGQYHMPMGVDGLATQPTEAYKQVSYKNKIQNPVFNV